MEKALVVFSGGQDSTTCLYWAKKKFESVEALSFNYGQRHSMEVKIAEDIALGAGVPWQVFHLDLLNKISENSLTDPKMEVDKEKPANQPPNTLVEGRNMLFITYAAIYAKSKNIHNIVTGVGQADYSGYPDCRNEFIVSLNKTLNLSMEYEYKIHTPLMWKNKKEIWAMADQLEIFDLVRYKTLTCYNGIIGEGCGHCPACFLRKRGLDEYLKETGQK